MKKILLTFMLTLGYVYSYSQCTPNPIYQDSTYNIWPDTITGLPTVIQGQAYSTTLNVKTPSTLLEANSGDSSILYIDTFGIVEFVGGWPVDSMELVEVYGLPSGLDLFCESSDCMLPGETLTCAYLDGTTTDPIGIYPIELLVNVYTHGFISFFPVSTDLYSALGSYESITGYKIVVSNTSSYELFNSNNFTLLQNVPNPTNGITTIKFNTPSSDIVSLLITDMFGKVVYSEEVSTIVGINELILDLNLNSGVYNYSIQNDEEILSKRMIISE